MARPFRFFVKKRGGRSTSSRTLGGAAMGIFFALAFLGGAALTVHYLTSLVIPEWRVNHVFRRTTCTVSRFRLAEQEWLGSTNYRPEFLIVYEVDGHPFQTWTYDIARLSSSDREAKAAVRDEFVDGVQYSCWYDPNDPATAVLVRGYSYLAWTVLLIPIGLLVVGGGGLAYLLVNWGKSLERRAATGHTVALAPFEQNGVARGQFPFVPDYPHLSESPGTTLAIRLAVGTSPAWALVAALVVSIVANGLAGLFVYLAVRSYLDREPDIWLMVFAVPLLLGGIATLFYFARRLMETASVGSTILEVSDHPLRPGVPYDLYLRQTGRLQLGELAILLVCEEKATYQQGTNSRTEARRVHQSPILTRENVELQYGTPLEANCKLCLPPTVMHSFKCDHNEVAWQLVVTGRMEGDGGFERRFPIVVCPPQEERPQE